MMSLMCVVDANVLIDLDNGGLLEVVFQLPLRWIAPDRVIAELNEPDGLALLRLGLEQRALPPEWLAQVLELRATHPQLSVGDCAAFVLARRLGDEAVLLTGDARLRRHAESAGVTVHGVLWALDQIDLAGLMPAKALAGSLQRMMASGARLPEDECQRRLVRWGEGA